MEAQIPLLDGLTSQGLPKVRILDFNVIHIIVRNGIIPTYTFSDLIFLATLVALHFTPVSE